MSTIILEAEARSKLGKGASRRLRRLENNIPAIVYGGDKAPENISLAHHKIIKVLEDESIYSSVFHLNIAGTKEQVILKSLQRHPYKPIIMHMDFQRVSAKEELVRMVPLHFLHEQKSPGVLDGGVINHTMMHVEVRCLAANLPEFIEVDLSGLTLDSVLHLSDLKLPANVQLASDPMLGDHNHPVVSIHMSRASVSEENEANPEEGTASDAAAE